MEEIRNVLMTAIPCDADLLYLAGLFDGEGHIGAGRLSGVGAKGQRVRINCGLTMRTHAGGEVVQLFYERWGGYFREGVPRGSAGTPCSIWQATNRVAVRFLLEIAPHLRVKHRQAVVALAFDANRIMPRGKGVVDGRRGGTYPLSEEGVAQRETFFATMRGLNR